VSVYFDYVSPVSTITRQWLPKSWKYETAFQSANFCQLSNATYAHIAWVRSRVSLGQMTDMHVTNFLLWS
jgi:hypothetical protein